MCDHMSPGADMLRIAILDDYQNVALESADWSSLAEPGFISAQLAGICSASHRRRRGPAPKWIASRNSTAEPWRKNWPICSDLPANCDVSAPVVAGKGL